MTTAGRVPFDGTIVLTPGCVTYLGPAGLAETHAHHAVQLVVARDQPFELTTTEGTSRLRVALVPAGAQHALDAHGDHVAILLFERHGPHGRALDRVAREGIPEELRARVLADPFPGLHAARQAGRRWTTTLLGELTPAPLSREVRRAIQELGRRIDTQAPLSLPDVATAVGLSPTRLTHRFSAEVGIPFRAFVPWLRVSRAAREVQSSRAAGLPPNLTQAAIVAGFVDSAHLTRTFRTMFGLPPSLVLSHAQLDGFEPTM